MLKSSIAPTMLRAVLLTPLLAACATPTLPPSSGVVDQIVQPVPNYDKAPCRMQRAWAAHNSKVESIRQGKLVVLKAPCDFDRNAPVADGGQPKPQAKASKTSDATFRDWGLPPRPVRPEVDADRARRVGLL